MARLLPEGPRDDDAERLTAMFRKEFEVRSPIKRAVVSVTGLGLYELTHQRPSVLAITCSRPSGPATANASSTKLMTFRTCSAPARTPSEPMLGGGWWTGPLMSQSADEGSAALLS